jgi:hypothetical protein
MADWQPLVTDPDQRATVIATIREIVEALPAENTTSRLDRALLRAYLGQDDTVADPDDEVGTLLAAQVTELVAAAAVPALFGGAAQLGWAIEHLAGGEIADRVCAAIDGALLRRLDDWAGEYDLISGLVGFGVYGLERADAGRTVVERVIELFEQTAQPRGGGVAWHTRAELLPAWQRESAPEGYWNLGLAHGVPGVIGFLARCVRHGVVEARAKPLLEQAMTYLLAAEPPPASGPRFPPWHPTDGKGRRRVAWCYGDLGVSIQILAAADACDREAWRAEGRALALACVPAEDEATEDAGLCHGTGGAMHLYARLARATGEAAFADAARHWLERTFAIRRPGESYAGFPSFTPAGEVRRVADPSLLTGAAGVALALHAMISEVEPSWDRMLLVDL